MPSFFQQFPIFGAPPVFADFAHDRLAERREDAAFVKNLLASASTRLILVADDAPLFVRRGGRADVYFPLERAALLSSLDETTLLGMNGQSPVFAAQADVAAVSGMAGVEVGELRGFALQGLGVPVDLGFLAQAKSVIYWHARNRRCASCGEATHSAAAGWRRECKACGAHHFPRTDPVVIMLAIDGDACLLGRQPRFAPGMYSALAGFLEPGETLENAVRREVREETGVRIGRVAYVGSQPWPFPSSLMLGCFAEALSRDLVVDRSELEDARWFRPSELRDMFAGVHAEGLRPPHAYAIAHRLLQTWLETNGEAA